MKISDIADIINLSEKDPANSGIDVFVGLEHYDIAEPVIKRFGSTKMLSTAAKKFEAGDVLIARRNVYLQRASVAKFSGLTSGDSIILRVKKELHTEETDCDTMCQLLPFILNSINFWDYANTNADGTMSKRLSPAMLQEYEFSLPSLAEQKVLAEKLWAAYEVKQSYLKMIAATEEMVKAQFIEMFGTPENNHKDYPIIIIGEKVKSINYGTSKPATDNGKYVYLRMNNITYDGKLDLSEVKRIDLSPEEDESAFVHKGDLMFNRTNTKEFVGKTTVFNLDEPMVVAGYIIRIRFNDDFSPEYVSGYLNSIYGKALLRKMAKGAVHQANINAQEFQRIRILDVPKQEQDKFDTILHQADKSISELRKSVDAIDKVIKSLINENL